jgi:uncharacterized protein
MRDLEMNPNGKDFQGRSAGWISCLNLILEMMQHNHKKIPGQLFITLQLLLWSCLPHAEPATEDDCRLAQLVAQDIEISLEYSDAVLWKISRDGQKPSYIFGTIHVSDPRITTLPAPVSEKLNDASVYVMEALPEPGEVQRFSQMMFFDDGTTLRDFLDKDLFNRASNILSQYNLSRESVLYLKPWAAFLLMNYPAEEGIPLDLQLLNIARQNGAELHGLETLSEQGNVFGTFDPGTQVRFLLDTVCNYDIVNADFAIMKSLYLKRDLNALYSYSNKYSFSQEYIYQDLLKKILVDRNKIMVDRMQSILIKGDAFIAIGALHLPGSDGVLSLLDSQGYRITPVY